MNTKYSKMNKQIYKTSLLDPWNFRTKLMIEAFAPPVQLLAHFPVRKTHAGFTMTPGTAQNKLRILDVIQVHFSTLTKPS